MELFLYHGIILLGRLQFPLYIYARYALPASDTDAVLVWYGEYEATSYAS